MFGILISDSLMKEKQMAEDTVLRKIQKLFALAGNNPNQAEAEAAMLKAQEMLVANGLTQKHIEDYTSTNVKEDVVNEVFAEKKQKSLKQWQLMLATVIATNFRCKILIWRGYRNSQLKIYGLNEDAEICKSTMEFSFVAFETMWTKFHKELVASGEAGFSRMSTSAMKNDYIRGFVKGLETKFAEQVQSKELMIVIPDAVIKTHKQHMTGTYHASTFRISGSENIYNRGFQDGKTLDKGKYLN